jgi:hypothetical protein
MMFAWLHFIASEYPGGISPHWNMTGAQAMRLLAAYVATTSAVPLIGGVVGYQLAIRRKAHPLIVALSFGAGAVLYVGLILPQRGPDPGAPAALGMLYGAVGGSVIGAALVSFGFARWLRDRLVSVRRGFPVESGSDHT